MIALTKQLRIGLCLMLAVCGMASLASTARAVETETVVLIEVEGIIAPVTAQYIERGIEIAEQTGATALVIRLNTPGGLLDSTEIIVASILNANVPVITYVSPVGAWAASAGTFITLASHVAAMGPATTIGAAHPVAAGQEIPEEQMQKITEFAAQWIGTIAEERGRNVEEAMLAVTESKSFSAAEALNVNLIDIRADNLETLLGDVDGWEFTLASGQTVVLRTAEAAVQTVDMTAFERFLHAISDPNVALILLTLATIGLITEISSPGLIFPGVVGAISLVMAFYSLGVLDAYWGGIALIVLAAALFIAEFFTTSFGAFTAGGVASLVFGSIVLFSQTPGVEVSPALIAGVAIGAAAFSVFVLGAIIRGQRRQKTTGREGMIGRPAIVKTPLEPRGTVLAEGELWSAIAEDDETIEPGEEVTITRMEGFQLRVRKGHA